MPASLHGKSFFIAHVIATRCKPARLKMHYLGAFAPCCLEQASARQTLVHWHTQACAATHSLTQPTHTLTCMMECHTLGHNIEKHRVHSYDLAQGAQRGRA